MGGLRDAGHLWTRRTHRVLLYREPDPYTYWMCFTRAPLHGGPDPPAMRRATMRTSLALAPPDVERMDRSQEVIGSSPARL